MADSPSKRRKISPTASVPVDASNTPSRIPVSTRSARNTPNRRPSFASPTKASLSRHNPQLLNRPSSSGEPFVRPGSRGRDLQDVFAQALAGNQGRLGDSQFPVRDGSESATTTQENDPPTEVLIAQSQNQAQRATTPKMRSGNVSGSGISGKARRMSRSPSKRSERPPFEHPSQLAETEFRDDINPFQKKGLRRSPLLGSQQSQPSSAELPIEHLTENPFKKTGLRRSPIASQTKDNSEEGNARQPELLEIKRTGSRRSPISSKPTEPSEREVQHQQTRLETQRGGLRRSPVALQTMEVADANSAQQQLPFGSQKGGLRRSPISSLAIEDDDVANVTNSQRRSHGEIPTVRLSVSSAETQMANFIEQSTLNTKSSPTEQPDVTSPMIRPPPPSLVETHVQRRSALRRSPIVSQLLEQTEGEEQHEQQAEAQLEVELQDSAIATDPVSTQPSPEVLPDKSSRTSHLIDRPAQHATTELLRVTPDAAQEIRSKSPKIAKAPAQSVVEEIMNPFMRRRFEEPELPPTPPQRGIPDPVVTTPPSGIHDTPSKRARRRNGIPERHKSSPLKPKNARPEAEPNDKIPQIQAHVQPKKLTVAKESSRRRRSSRFVPGVDPHEVKKQKREDLLRQLQQLQADVTLANQENERIRTLSESKKKLVGAAPNATELLAMLLRSTAPELPPKTTAKEMNIQNSMDVFLPFRPRRKPVVTPVSKRPLPSHLPLSLDDPLPYLQAFSPLAYTSTITLTPVSETSPYDAGQIAQKYVINASHPSGLFASRLSMVADPETLAIKTIDILRLDMSAEVELGTFIRARAEENTALGKDITVICWAMARWVEVSIQRAKIWCAVKKEFGTSLARAVGLETKKKKRKRQAAEADEDDMDEDEKRQWTRRELLPYIGRTSMELIGEDVELRFEWKINFDFTGEVESILTADARIPEGWRNLDDRNSLAKVSETFDRLVKDRGALGAVRALVGLLLS